MFLLHWLNQPANAVAVVFVVSFVIVSIILIIRRTRKNNV
jgi:hypothetical protein